MALNFNCRENPGATLTVYLLHNPPEEDQPSLVFESNDPPCTTIFISLNRAQVAELHKEIGKCLDRNPELPNAKPFSGQIE
jgi:hypothetical protein